MPRGCYERKKRGKYNLNLKQVEEFLPIFKQMVNNARAHYGILDADGASQLLPDVPPNPKRKGVISSFDLIKKIKHWHGTSCVRWFHEYFGEAQRRFDKRRVIACEKAYKRGELTLAQLREKRARCFTWTWVLRPEKRDPPTC